MIYKSTFLKFSGFAKAFLISSVMDQH